MIIGVLALQGDFALHQESLRLIGVNSKAIRCIEDLDGCDGLIMPGGESTTFIKLIHEIGLYNGIVEFAKKKGIMGTCAGLIALATRITNDSLKTLGLIDVEVERNAYGRQINSFIDRVHIPIFKDQPVFEGVFIRAPKIHSVGSGGEALGFYKDEIVMVRNQRVLVTTFHPELTKDQRIHRYFLEDMVSS